MILHVNIVHIRVSVLSPLSCGCIGAGRGLLSRSLCIFIPYGVVLALSEVLSTIDQQFVIDLIIFLFLDVCRLV